MQIDTGIAARKIQDWESITVEAKVEPVVGANPEDELELVIVFHKAEASFTDSRKVLAAKSFFPLLCRKIICLGDFAL